MNCWQGLVKQIFLCFFIFKDLHFWKCHKISFIYSFCVCFYSAFILNFFWLSIFFVVLILLTKMVQRCSKPFKSSWTRSNKFLKSRREKNKIHREEVIKNNNLIKTSQVKELERLTFEVEKKMINTKNSPTYTIIFLNVLSWLKKELTN